MIQVRYSLVRKTLKMQQIRPMKTLHQDQAPGKITSELILNGGKQVISALTLLLQACYLIGYFPKLRGMENRIYFKKMDKATYHIKKSYRSISLTSLFGKTYERILLQQATNILEENKFFEGKNLYTYQKNKMLHNRSFFLWWNKCMKQ